MEIFFGYDVNFCFSLFVLVVVRWDKFKVNVELVWERV